MAVYKIFPEKDTTIYSEYPNKNTGLDEILEASTYLDTDGNAQVSRFLIKFPQDEITSVFNNYITPEGFSWSASFKSYVANVTGLNSTTTVNLYLISGSWNMGTGRYAYTPEYENGASWYDRFSSGSGSWSTPGGDYYLNYVWTQSFSYYDNLDLNINLGGIGNDILNNNGFIIKQASEFVNNVNNQTKLQYFSRDTHTIYPPCLEIKWDDYSFNTGSLTQLNITPATISIDNNPGVFYPSSINVFRVNSSPEYPARLWQTSSYYTQNYYLPTASYYAIKDLDTNEYVIDFDNQFTKLSVDPSGSYFTLYMNGLEPERYYSILIKTNINGNTIVFDADYNFKVING
jgi:hypothetical protein